jgi:hypothetical protein
LNARATCLKLVWNSGAESISEQPCGVVEFLEDALEAARTGEIVGLCTTILCEDDNWYVDVVGDVQPATALGYVATLDADLRQLAASPPKRAAPSLSLLHATASSRSLKR